MELPDEADDIARAIDDQGKQANDIAAQHAYFERFYFGDGGILAAKNDLAPSLLTTEADLSFDANRPNHSP